MSVHGIVVAGVMRCRRMADADAAAKQDRHLDTPVAHVLNLCNLVDNFADAIEGEVGEHEVDHRSGTRHGGAAPQADEAALADGGIAEAFGSVELVKACG